MTDLSIEGRKKENGVMDHFLVHLMGKNIA